MGRGRAQSGVGWIGQRDYDSLIEFIKDVIDDSQRDVLSRDARGKSQRAAGERVIHAPTGGRAAGYGVIHGHGFARDGGEGDGQIGGRDRLGATGTGQAEGDSRRVIIVNDGTGASTRRNGGVDRVAEVDCESFVELVTVVAVDNHGD